MANVIVNEVVFDINSLMTNNVFESANVETMKVGNEAVKGIWIGIFLLEGEGIVICLDVFLVLDFKDIRNWKDYLANNNEIKKGLDNQVLTWTG